MTLIRDETDQGGAENPPVGDQAAFGVEEMLRAFAGTAKAVAAMKQAVPIEHWAHREDWLTRGYMLRARLKVEMAEEFAAREEADFLATAAQQKERATKQRKERAIKKAVIGISTIAAYLVGRNLPRS